MQPFCKGKRSAFQDLLRLLHECNIQTIPAAIEGYPVAAIEDAAFQRTAVVTVKIPYSVTEIGWFAFADCTSLTSVTLPASVASIGYGAFDGCPALTLYCPEGSYSADYAKSFALRHELT